MWATYREGNRQLWSLRALRSQLEREEGAAYDASLRAESQMHVLGDQIQDLDDEFAEAKEMLRSAMDAMDAGVGDPQVEQWAEEAATC